MHFTLFSRHPLLSPEQTKTYGQIRWKKIPHPLLETWRGLTLRRTSSRILMFHRFSLHAGDRHAHAFVRSAAPVDAESLNTAGLRHPPPLPHHHYHHSTPPRCRTLRLRSSRPSSLHHDHPLSPATPDDADSPPRLSVVPPLF